MEPEVNPLFSWQMLTCHFKVSKMYRTYDCHKETSKLVTIETPQDEEKEAKTIYLQAKNTKKQRT